MRPPPVRAWSSGAGWRAASPTPPPDSLTQLPQQFRAMFQQRIQRWESVDLENLLDGMSQMEFMLRFTISHPDLHTTIVGTSNAEHLAANLVAARKREPLPPDIYEAAKKRLAAA